MRRTLVLAIACAVALPAFAADERTALTLYRADGDQLFQTTGDTISSDGYAVVHERRSFDLKGGTQDLSIGGLPSALDSEALTLRFPGKGTRVVSRRLIMGKGFDGALAGLVGQNVWVIGTSGQDLAAGTLVQAGDPMTIRDGNGQVTIVRDYAALRIKGGDNVARGSTLQVRVDGSASGSTVGQLDYPTSGLGWRGAYVATLANGGGCSMAFDANASIANRSGRDWKDVALKLVAGDARRAKMPPMGRRFEAMSVAAPPPAPMAAADINPVAATLGDLRTYTLPKAVDLPDGSITQTPLYDSRTLACERVATYDAGYAFYGGVPNTRTDFGATPTDSVPVNTTLKFKAFDSLPAGYLRVLTTDRDGNAEMLGESQLEDTPKDENATVNLGNAFDLRVKRERTSFKVGDHQMDEGTRLTLTNAGDDARIVTVVEHASRWRAWKLLSSSQKPSTNTANSMEFKVEVPANGKATLDYAVRYTWTDADTRTRNP
ncbi:DUF4139 domain-containing protein [Luteibacter aegosomaticola]|jgi:hypothetical protein|uniref:DUF4139 domain-containing protein n=1 Tax=Luteibacter aegosomaticola TaxID=2911538 RepID=UPI001FF7A6E7|nr:DUF4139 domain-containing protein [Luteibacter aegosomaticola]UPG88905.1 DUF4139 domain-containing protein [Luteibacter aegosomaticola]